MNITNCIQHDSNHLLTPSGTALEGYPCLEMLIRCHTNKKAAYVNSINETRKFWISRGRNDIALMSFDENDYMLREAKKIACRSKLSITMKMLAIYADGNEHCYRDCWQTLFPQKSEGHDIDCWRSLENNGFIKFSSKHKYGRKYYIITGTGREMLAVCEVNYIYHRIARWFKIDEDDRAFEMIRGDMAGEDASNDMNIESFITLLEELFNPMSKMHMLGSCFKFMDNVVKMTKTEPEFYEKVTSPEVMAWLNSHKHYPGVEAYIKILAKIAKKQLKQAA